MAYGNNAGNCNVTESYIAPNASYCLGSWLSKQRSDYKRGEMKPERKAKFDVLANKGWLTLGSPRVSV